MPCTRPRPAAQRRNRYLTPTGRRGDGSPSFPPSVSGRSATCRSGRASHRAHPKPGTQQDLHGRNGQPSISLFLLKSALPRVLAAVLARLCLSSIFSNRPPLGLPAQHPRIHPASRVLSCRKRPPPPTWLTPPMTRKRRPRRSTTFTALPPRRTSTASKPPSPGRPT